MALRIVELFRWCELQFSYPSLWMYVVKTVVLACSFSQLVTQCIKMSRGWKTYTTTSSIFLHLDIEPRHIRPRVVWEYALQVDPEVVVLRAVDIGRPRGDVDCFILHFVDVVDYVFPSAAAVLVADEIWAVSDVGHVVEWHLGLVS